MNDSSDQKIQQINKICEQIHEVLDDTKDPNAIHKEGMLSPRLKKLIKLGSAIASQLECDVVASCVVDCPAARATCDEVKEVLRQAILIAEPPARTYTRIVHEAKDAFENRH